MEKNEKGNENKSNYTNKSRKTGRDITIQCYRPRKEDQKKIFEVTPIGLKT